MPKKQKLQKNDIFLLYVQVNATLFSHQTICGRNNLWSVDSNE